MKTKLIFWILVLMMVCTVFSTSRGADKFYYGTYGGSYIQDFPSISDSLRFNIVYDSVSAAVIQYYVDNSLRAIVSNHQEGTPAYRASYSHYTLWEAERYPDSYYHLYYDRGTLVSDTSASGGKAMKFTYLSTRLIQWGPSYEQERGPESYPINYTAEFNLKFISALYDPPNQKSGNPPVPVCSLIVKDVARDSILKSQILYRSDFPRSDYKTFYLEDYTVPSGNRIDFQIYLFGTPTAHNFYVDYVKVYDGNGKELIKDKRHDQEIMNYVSQEWVDTTLANGDTVVYRWYLRDEPNYVDLFEPGRYIDSLIHTKSTERVGFQAFNQPGTILEGEYLLRQNPNEYSVDIYPTRWYGPDSSGENFQIGMDTLMMRLSDAKQIAITKGKDLWVFVQAHYFGYKTNRPDTCACCTTSFSASEVNYPGTYCYHLKRPPTSYEVRLQNFLALCYGAKSILNYCYYSYNSYQSVYHDTVLNLGLYNHIKNKTTDRWREIRDFTSPRVNILGPVLNQLTWQGACSNQEAGSFVLRNIQPSYIDSIVGIRNPDSTYVQAGFFTKSDSMFFMLVNRRTLPSEYDTFEVYFNFPDGPYVIADMYNPAVLDGKIYGFNRYMIFLQPGEGRLFRIERNTESEGKFVNPNALTPQTP